MPPEVIGGSFPMCCPPHTKVLCVSDFEGDEDIIEFIDEGILPCKPWLMFLKLSVMIVQVLFMAFMPSLEAFEFGFNDGVEGV